MTNRMGGQPDLTSLLPDGYVLVDFVVSMQALDASGDMVLLNYRTPDLTAWEALGMLTCASDDIRARMQQREGGET
ncbi:hypothetical protein ABT320_01675 [Streptomyces cellulosae]